MVLSSSSRQVVFKQDKLFSTIKNGEKLNWNINSFDNYFLCDKMMLVLID